MKTPFLLKFGYRNLLRNKSRTLIMCLGLILATAYSIFALNFARSGSAEVVKNFLKQYSGSEQEVHPEYYPDKLNYKRFNPYRLVDLEEHKDILTSKKVKRITLPVFLIGKKNNLGVLLTGIEPQKEKTLSKVHRSVTQGHFLSGGMNNEILIGQRLALKLGVVIGDEVGVIGQAINGAFANDLFTVTGIINFGGGDLEETLSFTNLKASQYFANIPSDQVHQVVNFDLDHLITKTSHQLNLVSWKKILPEISVSISFIDHFTWIVSLVIVLVICLGLSNTLMISFLEREAEFKTLNILGAKSTWVLKALFIEIALLSFIGIGLGIVLGHLITVYFSIVPINLEMFTNGKPIMLGGMTIKPLVRLAPDFEIYWKTPLTILSFLLVTLIYPFTKIIRRSQRAH